jgi:sirohydrochlorin ferrochelatase
LSPVSAARTTETGDKDGQPRSRPALVAVAHGSKDPRAAATVDALLSLTRSQAAERGLGGLDVRAAFLDHAAPSLRQVLSGMGHGACVVVPLLLTDAYHSKTDIPAQLASARPAHPELEIRYADTLGPHPLLLAALERRLAEAGSAGDRSATSVVLAAAGSSDPAANATIAALAARWQRSGGWHAVVPAYASAASPAPGDAVRELRVGDADSRVIVATYLLAPGYFADKIRRECLAAGASAVSGALGAAREVAEVIIDRYQAGVASRDSAVPVVARAQLS